jgi:hypothetical protein
MSRSRPRGVVAPVALALLAALAFATTLALAQTKAPARRGHHPKLPKGADSGAPSRVEQGESAAVPSREPDSRPVDGGAIEAKTLDGGTRVFRFGEVEIEGRLRNPQLVYFLRRVRAEFAAGELGHRSFMRELSDTRHDPSF